MKAQISKFILKLQGWSIKVSIPNLPKAVVCVAPHTSNWDFWFGKLGYTASGRSTGFLIKKEWFFFPFNLIFKSMGGVPVSRGAHNSLVKQVVAQFESHKEFSIAITPEGTRKKNAKWKKGFYYIAVEAKVPIVLAYLDYAKKEMGLGKIFYPTGDEVNDIKEIKSFYKNVKAKYPSRFAI